MMAKLDLTKTYKHLFTATDQPEWIEVPPANYIQIEGRGAPGSDVYQESVSALYTVAYKLKFLAKAQGTDFVVCKLEGLWWFDDVHGPTPPREEWNWTMMIHQPDFVSIQLFKEAQALALQKQDKPKVAEVKLHELQEGLSAQLMHHGLYSTEEASIQRLHEFVKQQGYQLRDHHHEIYLKDPMKTQPEKLLTILRHPVIK